MNTSAVTDASQTGVYFTLTSNSSFSNLNPISESKRDEDELADESERDATAVEEEDKKMTEEEEDEEDEESIGEIMQFKQVVLLGDA